MFASHIRLVTFGMWPNFFFRRLNNWKQSLQYLMKCLCCGTWTHPHPQRPAASQVGHYCSHLQRARASLRQQWCQSSGICCKTAGDVGAVPYPSTGRTEYRCSEKKKRQQQQPNVAPRAKLLPLSLATLQPAARLLLPSTPRDYSALPAQTQRTHFFWRISPVNSENTALRWYHPLSAPPSPLMIQCINTFSHQRGADVLRYRILGQDWERCFKKH